MMSRCFHIPYNFEVKNGTHIIIMLELGIVILDVLGL